LNTGVELENDQKLSFVLVTEYIEKPGNLGALMK
jgi:tRNA G18 (ribose-2'-O)-methylase SpoU